MESQVFSPADCSPDAGYYIASGEPEEDHDAWADYCFEASKVSRERILECVLSSLDTDDSLWSARNPYLMSTRWWRNNAGQQPSQQRQ